MKALLSDTWAYMRCFFFGHQWTEWFYDFEGWQTRYCLRCPHFEEER